MLGNLRKVTSGLALIAVTCIKLVVEAFLESCRICVSHRLLWVPIYIIMDAFHQSFDIAPSTISVHFCLSWAISLALSKVRFSSRSSFWTAPSHVVFGLPLGRLTFRMPSARACFAGASSGSLNRWPIHSNLLFWIFLLHSTVFVLEYRSLFDIFFGHAIFKLFLSSDLWKMLTSSASFFVRVQARRCTKRCFLCMRWRFWFCFWWSTCCWRRSSIC